MSKGTRIADRVIQVIPNPEPGNGNDFWVGLATGRGQFWDGTCSTKECAENTAAQARQALAAIIDREGPVDFDRYQELAWMLARYPNRGSNLVYPALGLCGESGEVAEKVKKLIRDDGGVLSGEKREALKRELSDVLWYVSALAKEAGFTLAEIAEENLAKLNDRLERGVLHGSGDNR